MYHQHFMLSFCFFKQLCLRSLADDNNDRKRKTKTKENRDFVECVSAADSAADDSRKRRNSPQGKGISHERKSFSLAKSSMHCLPRARSLFWTYILKLHKIKFVCCFCFETMFVRLVAFSTRQLPLLNWSSSLGNVAKRHIVDNARLGITAKPHKTWKDWRALGPKVILNNLRIVA